jgi:gamma-glutamyltranspeptidase / glutathione hydrolase
LPNEWVSKRRFHHQYLPDKVQHEPGSLTSAQLESLQKKGHKIINLQKQYGNMQAILWDKVKNRVFAASDPRGVGKAVVAK